MKKLNLKKNITLAVVGPHYAGKSTLCTLLEQKLGFTILQEQWWKDPYREDSTNDFFKDKDFFRSEVWYLLQNAKSQKKALALNKKGKNVILDTFIYSTLIFASTVLSKKDLKLFKSLFDITLSKVNLPDVIIYLTADPRFLFETRRKMRIQEKTGPAEDEQTPYDWYKKVWDLNEYYFKNWNKTKFIKINVKTTDIKDEKTFQKMVEKIEKALEEKPVKA